MAHTNEKPGVGFAYLGTGGGGDAIRTLLEPSPQGIGAPKAVARFSQS